MSPRQQRSAPTALQHPPGAGIGDRIKAHRRELMVREFERVAMDLFVERGFADVSVDDIAHAAGVSTRTFYRYFTAKEDILALYPGRLTDFVRSALNEEPLGTPIFDVMSSVLVRLARAMDLEELRRWCGVMMSDRHSYSSMALNDLDLRHNMEPLLDERSSGSSADPLLFDLALRAGQAAMSAATAEWHARGGDFVTLVQHALSVFSRGFADAQARPPSVRRGVTR